MKSANLLTRFLLAAVLLLTIAGCEKSPPVQGCTDPNAANYNARAQQDNGTCTYEVTFYFDENGPNATVYLNNGDSANITANYQISAPDCGPAAAGCANFILPTGTYTYNAYSAYTSWTNGVLVVDGSVGCQEIKLQQSTGSATFWTASSAYGNITVTMNSSQGTITSYITNGPPTCGFDGCVTFDVPAGTYAYTATAQNGATWSGNVNVAADVCSTVQF